MLGSITNLYGTTVKDLNRRGTTQYKMTHSEQLDKLFTALAKFQGKVSTVAYDSKVKVKTKSGHSYEFEYASLKAVINATQSELSENGLAVTQLLDTDGDKTVMRTIITHSSGQFISGTFVLPIKQNDSAQEIGSTITYIRRYAYSSALRLNSDSDDDGNLSSGNSAEHKPTGSSKPSAPKKTTKSAPAKKAPKKDPEPEESSDAGMDWDSYDEVGPLVAAYQDALKNAAKPDEFRKQHFDTVQKRIQAIKG